MCGSCGVYDLLGMLFGYLVQIFYLIFKNFGVAIIFFTIATRLLMFPLTIKQQKSTAAQQRLQPKLNELKNKYGNNQQAYNQAVQELYAKEGVSSMGGCLPMLIQFPLFFGMYAAIRQPLSNVLHIGKDMVTKLCQVFGITQDASNYYSEISLIEKIRDYSETGTFSIAASTDSAAAAEAAINNSAMLSGVTNTLDTAINGAVTGNVSSIMGDKMDSIVDMAGSFNFLGLDLLQQASLKPMNMALILAVVVVIAQIGSTIITNKINKVQATQGCNPNLMGIMFGGMSFFFALSTPAAFPLYWTVSSLLGPAQSWITREYFGPVVMNARAEAERNARLKIDEGEVVKSITEAKGALKLKPVMPAIKEKTAGSSDKNENNKKNNNKNNGKKNKGGNPGGYVGKKK